MPLASYCLDQDPRQDQVVLMLAWGKQKERLDLTSIAHSVEGTYQDGCMEVIGHTSQKQSMVLHTEVATIHSSYYTFMRVMKSSVVKHGRLNSGAIQNSCACKPTSRNTESLSTLQEVPVCQAWICITITAATHLVLIGLTQGAWIDLNIGPVVAA